jgi:hypothetical protein
MKEPSRTEKGSKHQSSKKKHRSKHKEKRDRAEQEQEESEEWVEKELPSEHVTKVCILLH